MPFWRYRWREAGLAEAGFLLAQQAAIDEGAETDQVVTLATRSDNGLSRLEGAAASEERQSTELALAFFRDWRADG